jgi:outer membrane lipoprotein-sorting protein
VAGKPGDEGAMMLREATMKSRSIALPFLCVLMVACGSSPSSPVDEIVNANITARGGIEAIESIESIRAIGTATTSGGRVARVVQEIKRPGYYRLEFSSQGTKAVFAHDGEIGWQVAPLQGVFEPQRVTPENDSEAGIDERDIEGPLVNWREKGHTVSLVGRETLPGGEADKLEIKLADGGVRYDYVDAATHQVVRSDTTEMINGHEVRLQVNHSDFREVAGLMFPFLIETRVTDRPESITITVEKIEINPEIDDSRFRFPGEEAAADLGG